MRDKVLRMTQHQIGFLFLGAGASTRMRGRDKLLQTIDGVPLLQRILNEALKLNFPVFVTIPVNDTKRKRKRNYIETTHNGIGNETITKGKRNETETETKPKRTK